ncbi:MAG: hypothetical protein MK212_04510 [Saprospiraceae bacterium]|nr:hypothetical protein [Saprospiraceae bacterium]
MKKRFAKYTYILLLSLTISAVMPTTTYAQCPMCRASAESNLKNGGTDAQGLNKGIAYLLFMPYLMIGSLGWLWWQNRRKVAEYERDEKIMDLLGDQDI